MVEPAFEARKLTTIRCEADELLKAVHWHIPAVTVLDFALMAASASAVSDQVSAASSLGTKVVVINCASAEEAQEMMESGASDCTARIDGPQALEALTMSVDTLITQTQLGSGKSWWKRILT